MPPKLTWTDVEDLGLELAERYPDRDPFALRFTELRQLIESLPNFDAKPGQHVNETILEAIQTAWNDERIDANGDGDDKPGFTAPRPFRPE